MLQLSKMSNTNETYDGLKSPSQVNEHHPVEDPVKYSYSDILI